MLERAGSTGVDPPRLVQPCQPDAERMLCAMDRFVLPTIMRMLEPCAIAAIRASVVALGVSQFDDHAAPDGRDLCSIVPANATTKR